jgi:DNA-binding MarR family transcriptional regulator
MLDVREFRKLLRKFERQLEIQLVDCCGGISVAQCHALFAIEDFEPTTITHLSQEMGLEKSTLSRTIEGLVGLGLVDRTPDPNDRRIQQLTLTEAGEKACEENHRMNDSFFHQIFQELSIDDQENIVKYLTKYIEAVENYHRKNDRDSPKCCE